jgi:hypothetical protein
MVEPQSALSITLHVQSARPGLILEVIDHATTDSKIVFTRRLPVGRHEVTFSYRPISEHMQLSFGLTTFGGNPCGELRISAITVDLSQRLTGALSFLGRDGGAVYLNLRGREPVGVVLPGIEETNLKQRLVHELLAWKAAGQSVVTEAYTRDAAYAGPYTSLAPDVVFWSDHLRPLQTQSGTHRFDGVFVAYGPGIAPGRKEQAQIVDVMPTALYLLGQAIPKGLDGHVLTAMMEAQYLTQHPVTMVDDQTDHTPGVPATFTADEQTILEGRLRDLGYIE